ncbi:M56 family metallopeptidase [Flavobacterium chuncheonense]|uniref:M56 family metallopeptidase n=1 Tax=Flavobacterium chuncheonense TaxID=2026653 RepID=A0ABW5YLL7_9FLAO
MEQYLVYFLKVNGLLILFFLSYHFLLRKETFFQGNRWFLLMGVASSFILPLITFTETVWIEQETLVYENLPLITQSVEVTTTLQPSNFNWETILMWCYFGVSIVFLFRLTIELLSFFKIIKNSTKTKNENIILVETKENQNPFSFFNYLIFNKDNFTTEELELIVIHEKVHIEQKHSIDVLVAKLLCMMLWINPIVWLYRKAVLENLEYIADYETSKISNKLYEYQKTLLKVVTHQHSLSFTNQFYQSLIKKRIVMLNTNPSNKKNVWKFSLIIPAVVTYVLLFQVKTIAQVKKDNLTTNAVVVNNEINQKKEISESGTVKNSEYENSNATNNSQKNGFAVTYETHSPKNDTTKTKNKKQTNENISYGVTYETHSSEDNIKRIKEDKSIDYKKALIIFNDKEINSKEIDKIIFNSIATIITLSPTEKVIKKYGEKASNGVIIIEDNEHKKSEKSETLSDNKDVDFKLNGENESFVITKNSSNEDLNFYQSILKKSGFNMTYFNIKRNTKGEITQIHLKLDNNDEEVEKVIEKNTGIEDVLIGMQKGKPFISLSPQKKEPIMIITEDGNHNILFGGNMLKIPGEPTTKIENGKLDIYVNGKKLSNPEDFLTMDHSKIYYMKVVDKETLENNSKKGKRIDVKTK